MPARTRAVGLYALGIATHYDVLGVPSDASPSEIRTAYRERARRHHPDHAANDLRAQTTVTPTMAQVNEAYRVLGEPGRRALYDRTVSDTTTTNAADLIADSLREDGHSQTAPAPKPTLLSPSGPARVPWKLMTVAAVLGSAVILVTSAFNDPPSQEPPDGIIRSGSCVVIETNGDAREVACTNTAADVVVELLLPTGATCPSQLAAHRDRLGLGTACIPYD
jgi:hypothetical protein